MTRTTRSKTEEVQRVNREDIIRSVAQSAEGLDDEGEMDNAFLGPDASGVEDELDEVVRGHSGRDIETREFEAREPDGWLPRSSLPDPEPEPGWTFRWVRIGYGTKGGDDAQNVGGRMREGWVVVRPEEQRKIARTLVRGGEGQDRIVIGELMLCKIPTETAKARFAYYNRQSKLQAAGVKSQLLSLQDARMPLLRPSVVSTTSKRPQG